MVQERMKQTEIGEIPESWRVVRLETVADISSGNLAPQDKSSFKNGVYPFCRTSDVGKFHITNNMIETNDYLNKEGIKGLNLFKKNTILFPKSGASTFLNHRVMLGMDSYVSNHLATIYANKRKMNSNFLFNLLCLIDAKELTSIHDYPSLKLSQLRSIEIACPPLMEQKKIAAVLSKIQQNIDVKEELIKTTTELKKSMMQHLFTYGTKGEKTKQTEIGEIPDSWKIEKLSNSYEFTKKPKILKYEDKDTIVFVPMEMIPFNEIYLKRYLLKSPTKISSGTYFEEGDLLVSKITPSFENGKQCIVKKIKNGFGIATTEVVPIKEISSVSNILFLFYYLLKNNVRSDIANKMEGTTGRKRVPLIILKELLVPLPLLSEQKKITSILSKIDERIQNYEAQKSTLQALFKSMLNKLMTGQIRVHELDIDVSEVE